MNPFLVPDLTTPFLFPSSRSTLDSFLEHGQTGQGPPKARWVALRCSTLAGTLPAEWPEVEGAMGPCIRTAEAGPVDEELGLVDVEFVGEASAEAQAGKTAPFLPPSQSLARSSVDAGVPPCAARVRGSLTGPSAPTASETEDIGQGCDCDCLHGAARLFVEGLASCSDCGCMSGRDADACGGAARRL